MGRNIKLYKSPNMLKIFIEAPFMKVSISTVEQLIKFLLDNEVLLAPYSCGIDMAHPELKIPDHLHLHGYTKHTESYIKGLLKAYMEDNKYIFNFDLKTKGSYSIVSSVKKVEDEDAFLRYPIKDRLVDMVGWEQEKINAQMKLASEEYKYKLNQKKKKIDQETNKMSIYEYLGTLNQNKFKDQYLGINEVINNIKREIIKYAIENTRLDYLGKFKLEQVALMYLGKQGILTNDEILTFLSK